MLHSGGKKLYDYETAEPGAEDVVKVLQLAGQPWSSWEKVLSPTEA